ncbi:MAG: hypothetical protein WCA19_00920 [Candidatus Acidiferrales bacterium]
MLVAILIVTVAAAFGDLEGLFDPGPEHPAIGYATRPAKDRVSELNRKIHEGKVQLKFDGEQGYLRSVLEALDVPIESQIVVFSKTSLEMNRINPRNPRTLFFNDSVAVGWVRGGGIVELAAEDPQQGVIFYTLEQKPADKPIFVRRDDCLNCHESYSSLGVPGMLVRSVFPAPDGTPMREFDDYIIDHRSPFGHRWGGWYVTGNLGSIRHMGNAMVTDPQKPEAMVTDQTLNLDSLKGKFDTDAYLSPYSDIVALMVFEHQTHMVNLFTRVGWEIRFAQYQERVAKKKPEKAPGDRQNTTVRLLDETARELVDYLLFVDEAPLADKIQGTSGFAEKFSARGPRDPKGRSLRQFDLERRLMRYPCSYMIYSEAFDGLPVEARDAIYKRMWQILSGEERDGKYALFSRADREAIVEILRETKKGLPKYFEEPITR